MSADDKPLHIEYVVRVRRDIPRKHLGCDGVEGGTINVHTRADVDRMIAYFRKLGFKVYLERQSTCVLVDELPDDAEMEG